MTEEDWLKLANKRIFFGHQSVGYNIIDGIIDLKNQYNITSFIILETKDTSDFKYPLLVHSKIGKNLDPKSKVVDFVKILESGVGNLADIAFMKLCYADFHKSTNINELFEYYQTSIIALQKKYPHLKLFHCTVPLSTKPKGPKGLIKRILKMDNNVYINKYNQLMRNYYNQNEIFDIAKIETTFSDGTINKYGTGTLGLLPEYTSDGGHLNQYGRILIAHELLKKLLMDQ
jgi:hypothetical protein